MCSPLGKGVFPTQWMGYSLALSSTVLMGGCYFVNQTRFEHSVSEHVVIGMPLQVAIANLGVIKLRCTDGNPIDCSRLRQGLQPYSCVERVRLHWSMERIVDAIEVPKITCAGL
jgi:hypothetical protein